MLRKMTNGTKNDVKSIWRQLLQCPPNGISSDALSSYISSQANTNECGRRLENTIAGSSSVRGAGRTSSPSKGRPRNGCASLSWRIQQRYRFRYTEHVVQWSNFTRIVVLISTQLQTHRLTSKCRVNVTVSVSTADSRIAITVSV